MNILKRKKDYAGLSLPKVKTVRGIEIKKAPLGKYLAVMEMLYDFPAEVFGDCFSDMSAAEILNELKSLKPQSIKQVSEGICKKGPLYAVKAIACIADVTEEQLLQDCEIGLEGIFEIIQAVIEVNGLGKYISQGRQAAGRLFSARGGFSK